MPRCRVLALGLSQRERERERERERAQCPEAGLGLPAAAQALLGGPGTPRALERSVLRQPRQIGTTGARARSP